MIRTSRITAIVSVALALMFCARALAQSPAQEEAPPATVSVDEIIVEPLSQTAPIIGRMVERQSGVVAALISGPVKKVHVEVGDRVAAGDVLAVLVTDLLEAARNLAAAELAESAAVVKSAEAKLALVRQELKRLDSLKKSAAFSQARFDDKRLEVAKFEGELAQSKAGMQRARANLRLAEISLYNAAIRAPYAGVVIQRHTVEGAYLNTGDPVVNLVNDEQWEIEADVPADYLEGLAPGVEVAFKLGKEHSCTARVRAVVPDENPRTRTRAVRFVPLFGGEVRRLAANQSVVLEIPVGAPREVATVHKDAVIVRENKNLVFVVVDGTAQIRSVLLGQAVGGRFEVVEGLSPGEVVVVRGNERLLPGQKVRSERGS